MATTPDVPAFNPELADLKYNTRFNFVPKEILKNEIEINPKQNVLEKPLPELKSPNPIPVKTYNKRPVIMPGGMVI